MGFEDELEEWKQELEMKRIYKATYRVPADPDLYPGGANEILVFDNQGNLFNVAWPGDTQYNALKQAYINQATNGNTTGFANGVTVTNIPAIGTY